MTSEAIFLMPNLYWAMALDVGGHPRCSQGWRRPSCQSGTSVLSYLWFARALYKVSH